MPQDIPVTCDDFSKKLFIEHSLSFPKGGLVLEQHDDAANEWSVLGDWDLTPSDISYKP